MAHVDRERLAYFLSKLQSWVASYAPSKDVATSYSPGLMSAADKAKLDGLQIDAALNAASVNPVQNRALAQALQALDGRVGDLERAGSTTYTYKGSVPTYADLPASGNQPGDVYDVLTAPNDGSWAWDGDSWNKLSGFVDLSALATKDVATPSSDGLMSAADKASLDALLQGFVPLWSASQDYSASSLVRGSDGALYLSKQASGPGTAAFAQNPVNDSAGTYWGRIPSDAAELLHLAGAETVTGQKTFTQPIVGDVTGSASHAGTADSASYAEASGGAASWSALKDYAKGSLALGSDGKIYYAASASGPNAGGAQDPTADDGTYWTAIPSSDSDVVHISGDEDIVGYKTFMSGERISNNHGLVLKDPDRDIMVAPGDNSNCYIQFVDKNDLAFSAIQRHYYASGANALRFMIRALGDDSTTLPTLSSVGLTITSDSVYHFSPTQEYINLGYTSGFRWNQVYAKSATISTSDARFKTEPEPVPDAVLDAWGGVGFVQFQMLDAVADKGADKARLHSGLIAQRIDQAFRARGLDASRYGLFCWDSWEAEPEVRDEHGAVVEPARPAGDEYSLRYEEALCMEAAYQRRRADRAEARIAALEERLAALEAKFG